MRMLKGNIKLELAQTSIPADEPVRGSFVVTAKKAIEGNRLFVALIAQETKKWKEGDETKTEKHEIYRDEKQIEGPRQYPAGEVTTHQFELVRPASEEESQPQGTAGKALAFGMSMLSNKTTQVNWYVEVRLDAKGIDLYTSQQVFF